MTQLDPQAAPTPQAAAEPTEFATGELRVDARAASAAPTTVVGMRPSPVGPPPSPDLADVELVARLRRREEAAYVEFVTLYGGRMLALARRYFRSDLDAEDVVQDALVSIVRAIDRFEGQARLSTWVHRIVVNASLMRIRTRSRHPVSSLGEQGGGPSLVVRRPLPGRPEPVDPCAAVDLTDAVQHMLARLPDDHREAVRLRDIEGWEPAEICEELGISASTFKARLHRGRTQLRELLTPLLRAS